MRSDGVLPTIRSAPQTSRTLSAEEIHEIRSLPYARYLITRWWFGVRNRALREAGYRCSRCQAGRDLQVHHLSYERLGAEESGDLEVLCRGCHLGEHVHVVQSQIGIYSRILSEVVAERDWEDVSDALEEAKLRISKRRIPFHYEQFQAAAARLLPRVSFKPPTRKAELYDVAEHGPLTRAEAAGFVAKLGAQSLLRPMPHVRLLSEDEDQRVAALRIVLQALHEQVKVCEAAEREQE